MLQPFADLPPKMLRTWQPLSLLILLVLTATAWGQDGRCPHTAHPQSDQSAPVPWQRPLWGQSREM